MRMKRTAMMGFAVLLIAALIAGCGQTPSQPAAERAASRPAGTAEHVVTVEIENFKFTPAEITVAPGTEVVFINLDPTEHDVVEGTVQNATDTRRTPLFESPLLQQGESWSYVFEEEGEYSYICTVAGHYLMGMVGKVTVVAGADMSAGAHGAHDAVASAASVLGGNVAHAHQSHDHAAREWADLPAGLTPTPEGLVELEPFRVDGNVKEFHIDVQEVEHELVDGVVVTAWAFNGMMPGPVLRVTEGDLVRVHFENTHHQPHTIHWHGIYADQEHDGVGHTSADVYPGQTRVYEWVAEHPGTYLYHCHVDTYRHMDMGMYGAIIIDPKDEADVTWDQEYTIVVDDWDSNIEPMAVRYSPQFNYFLVNGKSFPDVPTLTAEVGKTTRFRLINASYSNVAMHLHGPHFLVVASDGRPLPHPYYKDTLDIAPGERYDVEIVPTKAGLYPFHAHNLHFVTNDGAYPGGMHFMVDMIDSVEEM